MNDLIENIKELQRKTGFDVSEIQNTLIETNNNFEAAYNILYYKAKQLREHTTELANQEIDLPIDKGDFYSLKEDLDRLEYNFEQKIENLECKLESIQDLLNELLETIKSI